MAALYVADRLSHPPQPNPPLDWGHIWRGPGAPSNDVGTDGDAHIDTSTGDFYSKAGGIWMIVQGAAGGSGEIGAVDPEGVVTAAPGTTYLNSVTGGFFVKQSGVGNTGWLTVLGGA